MAQRHDLPAGGPTGLIGNGIGNGYEPGSGNGYGPGGAPGARAAVVDGPGGPQDTGGWQEPVGPFGSGGPQGAGGRYGAGGTREHGGAFAPGDALPANATAGDVLAAYLHRQSAEFLRSLRLHRESGSDAEGAEAAARQLRAAARRISATLYTFRPLTEETWADQLRAELGWLSGTLAREHACARRRDRLMAALQRLTGRPERGTRTTAATERTGRGRGTERGERAGGGDRTGSAGRGGRTGGAIAPGVPAPAGPSASTNSSASTGPPASTGPFASGPAVTAQAADPDAESVLSAGAARAAALLDRQLTLARTRAHSAALQALGSARFHALADAVAVLASEAPLDRAAAAGPAAETLHPLADHAHHQLTEAVAALPLARAGHPYPADALGAEHRHDTPWHQVRALVRLSRYAQEVVAPDRTDLRLAEAGRALEHHRDAAEAATAAASAARTPRIAPATAYALGVLHADQRHDVAAARFTFGRLWLPAPAPESRWS
ncbi:CHAD domain-containing protein [Streptomyces sp. NPDC048644]|uniref:CHAD domain-containing protein n=1 Tax=Streptomyces sp. NPDC048644 TaxID=3365582 RepID=UPI0037122554